MDNIAYQEHSSNHERKKLAVVFLPYTVVKPLQTKVATVLQNITRVITKEIVRYILILGNDDQSDLHTCHKLYSACCT